VKKGADVYLEEVMCARDFLPISPFAGTSERKKANDAPVSTEQAVAAQRRRAIKVRGVENPPSPTGLRTTLREIERLRRAGAEQEVDFFIDVDGLFYSGGPPNRTVTWLEQFCVPASHTL
jgi:hypothetical protein